MTMRQLDHLAEQDLVSQVHPVKVADGHAGMVKRLPDIFESGVEFHVPFYFFLQRERSA
jgi:hypothetical protein